MSRRAPRARALFWSVLFVVWVLVAVGVGSVVDRGWVPHDEGALGQSAGRVLEGEIPHRDFDELYTGGLSYLHALAFRAFGTDLLALRKTLFIIFLLWVPALFYLATRFVGPLTAAPIVGLAAAWSLPVYSAAVPSWYNLFLAVFGAAALMRHIETGRTRWLFAAGVLGGLSILVKVAGAYYVLGALLFLVFREQRTIGPTAPLTGPRRRGYAVLLGVTLTALLAGLLCFIRVRFHVAAMLDFVFPGACVAAVLLAAEKYAPPVAVAIRVRRLLRLVTPFAAGIAVPLLALAAFYLRAGALGDLAAGMFLTPRQRLTFAAYEGPPASTALYALPALVLLPLAARLPRRMRWGVAALMAVLLAVLVVDAPDPSSYRCVWYSIRWLIPAVASAGLLSVAWGWNVTRSGDSAGPEPIVSAWDEKTVLLLALTALCGLVQFPFSAPVYFFYVAPLAALAGLAVMAGKEGRLHPAAMVLVMFYLLYSILWVDTGFIYGLGVRYEPSLHSERLDLPRGRIRVPPLEKTEYETLARFIRDLGPVEYLYAAPDAPEVSFLTATRNPTRVLFDFFDGAGERTIRTLQTIEEHDVRVVVINRAPQFSGPLPDDLSRALTARYPHTAEIGRFLVRWKR